MSMRALLAAANEFSALLNEVNASGRTLMQTQMKRVQDLTNDEVFWTRAQAVLTGTCSAITGGSGIAGTLVPQGARLGLLSTETIKEIIKAVGTGSNAIGDVGSTIARGQSTVKQSARSLVERCEISRLQQEDGSRNSSYSQMIQAVQSIMSAKSRLAG